MKKIMSLLLVLTMLFGLSAMATATTVGQLNDGNSTIELPFDTREPVVYTYTATQTGTLYISAEEFYCALGDRDYFDNSGYMDEWMQYTQLTVDGQLLEGYYFGSVEVVEGQTYTFQWEHIIDAKWYTLGWKAVLNLSYNDANVPKEGTEEMPVELYLEDCPIDSIEVPAGGSVWYMLYGFGGAEFVISGENAYVDMTALNPETMEQQKVHLEEKNGEVAVSISTYRTLIQIGNSGTEPAVYQLSYRYPLGSDKNPAQLVLGANVASVEPENYEGYIYAFTALCDGVLTLNMPEKNWTVMVYNMTTQDDGLWFDAPGERVITIEVKKGEVFWISITNFDETSESFVGGVVKFGASVSYSHSYVDGKCEHCGEQEQQTQVLLGDVNGDNRINSRDARALLQYLAGMSTEEPDMAAADYNGDGRLNVRDARAILAYIAGIG